MANNHKNLKKKSAKKTEETELEKTMRIQRCTDKIQLALTEDNCQFDVAIILKANQVIPQVAIISNKLI